ncbi:hypothetical protein EV182_003426, partial [Spiromyces aspiralis]
MTLNDRVGPGSRFPPSISPQAEAFPPVVEQRPVPPQPFTVQDVEVIRSMRLRSTRKLFRLTIFMEFLAFLAATVAILCLVIKYNLVTGSAKGFTHNQFWVFTTSVLIFVISGICLIVTLKRYKMIMTFYKNPSADPLLILKGQPPSMFRSARSAPRIKK